MPVYRTLIATCLFACACWPAAAGQRLIELIYDGKVAAVKRAVSKGADVNTRGKNALTPLIAAAFSNQLEIAKLLIEKGADANAHDDSGFVALVGAETVEMAELLIAHGADVNAPDDSCNTPLYFAISDRRKAVVELLIAKGAHVNARDRDNFPVLLNTTKTNDPDMAALLISKGAEVNPKGYNDTPLYRAADWGQTKLVDVLLAHGADVHATAHGMTPLHAAKTPEIAEKLVARGASLEARDETDKTPLISAISSENFGTAKFLISKGADVTARDISGETPLHEAARHGNLRLVKRLIEKGADPQARNLYNESVYSIAVRDKNKTIASYLSSKGVDTSQLPRPAQAELPDKLRLYLDRLDTEVPQTWGKAVQRRPGEEPEPRGWETCKAIASPQVQSTPDGAIARDKQHREALDLLQRGADGSPDLVIAARWENGGIKFSYRWPKAKHDAVKQAPDCRSAGPVVVPQGRSVTIEANSDGEIFDLEIPSLNVQATGMPGRIESTPVDTRQTGRFMGKMRVPGVSPPRITGFEFEVLDQAAYEDWEEKFVASGHCRAR